VCEVTGGFQLVDRRFKLGGRVSERLNEEVGQSSRQVVQPLELRLGRCIELGLLFGLPLAQYLYGIPVPGARVIDDLVVPPAQNEQVLKLFAVGDARVAPGSGLDRSDDVRDLTDEHRLFTIDENHRFVALRCVTTPATQGI